MDPIMRARATAAMAAISGLVAPSCGRDYATSPQQDSHQISSVTGIASTEAAMRLRLDRVTRLVALALGDAQVRAFVHAQLHSSRYNEHKLHFGPFLLQPGNSLAVVGTTASYTGPSGDTSFDLLLNVTSADQAVTDLLTVSVSSQAAPCPTG